MKYFHHSFKIKTVSGRPSFHDINNELNAFLLKSAVKNGMFVISTTHTTCSFFFDECMHDTNFYGDDYLHVDITNVLEKIAPKMTTENQYNSPGPKHIEFGMNLADPNYPAEKWVMLNTDAHIKSSLYGFCSTTLIIKDGKLLIGDLGSIFFVDWDSLRERERTINFMIMGD